MLDTVLFSTAEQARSWLSKADVFICPLSLKSLKKTQKYQLSSYK